jgi:hypothetical protein
MSFRRENNFSSNLDILKKNIENAAFLLEAAQRDIPLVKLQADRLIKDRYFGLNSRQRRRRRRRMVHSFHEEHILMVRENRIYCPKLVISEFQHNKCESSHLIALSSDKTIINKPEFSMENSGVVSYNDINLSSNEDKLICSNEHLYYDRFKDEFADYSATIFNEISKEIKLVSSSNVTSNTKSPLVEGTNTFNKDLLENKSLECVSTKRDLSLETQSKNLLQNDNNFISSHSGSTVQEDLKLESPSNKSIYYGIYPEDLSPLSMMDGKGRLLMKSVMDKHKRDFPELYVTQSKVSLFQPEKVAKESLGETKKVSTKKENITLKSKVDKRSWKPDFDPVLNDDYPQCPVTASCVEDPLIQQAMSMFTSSKIGAVPSLPVEKLRLLYKKYFRKFSIENFYEEDRKLVFIVFGPWMLRNKSLRALDFEKYFINSDKKDTWFPQFMRTVDYEFG